MEIIHLVKVRIVQLKTVQERMVQNAKRSIVLKIYLSTATQLNFKTVQIVFALKINL